MLRARVIFLVILLIAIGVGVFVINNQSQSRTEILTYSDPGRPHPTVTLDRLLPGVQVTFEPESPHVGDVITVHYSPINLGLADYTITLTPGGVFRALHASNQATITAPFENTLVEVINPDTASTGMFQLRALAAGTLQISIAASGEGQRELWDQEGTPHIAYYWTNTGGGISITIGE